jgi:four helix bundle protein
MDSDPSIHGRPATFENGQDIRDRAFDYGCSVVGFCEVLMASGGVGRLMVPQLLNCSLSFATMLEEARAAESDADFISKCCIGLKECRESWTRMRVCGRRKIGPIEDSRRLIDEGNELIAIVSAIIRNKKRNVAAKRRRLSEEKGRARVAQRQDREHEFRIPKS